MKKYNLKSAQRYYFDEDPEGDPCDNCQHFKLVGKNRDECSTAQDDEADIISTCLELGEDWGDIEGTIPCPETIELILENSKVMNKEKWLAHKV